MEPRKQLKLIREGDYLAEVEVKLLDSETGWRPYLSLDESNKLDRLRIALRGNDLATAVQIARVYRLTPIQRAEGCAKLNH